MIYNQFVNAITQKVTHSSLIPAEVDASDDASDAQASFYDYEPEEAEILGALLPQNLSTQIFSALLESSAAELAARMTAMDNATRNAGDMIDRLTLVYNRTRQANITKELIEIISGAEAL
jgi:F-type H+-transporting ATPase subunit gamma